MIDIATHWDGPSFNNTYICAVQEYRVTNDILYYYTYYLFIYIYGIIYFYEIVCTTREEAKSGQFLMFCDMMKGMPLVSTVNVKSQDFKTFMVVTFGSLYP